MASIFTFETDLPEVTSPWPTGPVCELKHVENAPTLPGMTMPRTEVLLPNGISQLEAEPQDGPIEYKLHLLLRPRQSFLSTTTVQKVSGSYLSRSNASRSHSKTEALRPDSPAIWAPSSQSRQNRLQHLTTQLIWRLQQSTPYHSTSKSSLVVPVLPESDVEHAILKGPGPLMPGLETSGGALYEIGVSDDGAFVGLTKHELEESLTVLRVMAFSIGCSLDVLKLITVGDCQWVDKVLEKDTIPEKLMEGKLWVAEVLVAPNMERSKDDSQFCHLPKPSRSLGSLVDATQDPFPIQDGSRHEQLRISMTGSTTSGKSSLLGTLSTSTLDNGRGKSRLSLLKHRHEIVSGVTSSLAQELFGYQEIDINTNIINYASANVSSWDDIHNASERGRLVFVIDSAGHPRYRRTTVRGLVSWAPHWTLCCVAADDANDSTGRVGATASSSEILGAAGAGVDLAKAHLDLCLKLKLPLVIVMTKLDLATKSGLRNTLANILSILKLAGRRPALLTNPTDPSEANLDAIASSDAESVSKTLNSVPTQEAHSLVPIVLTSAVTGVGIGKLHALLHELPVTNGQRNDGSTASKNFESPRTLFHVDEVFAMSSSSIKTAPEQTLSGIVLSGHLRYGSLEVGDHLLLGPSIVDAANTSLVHADIRQASSWNAPSVQKVDNSLRSRSLQRSSSGDVAHRLNGPSLDSGDVQAWQEVKVASLRNLRLPVRTLSADQAGTVGLTLCDREAHIQSGAITLENFLRRGMVLVSLCADPKTRIPPVYRRFSAVFEEAGLPAWPGVLVIVYIASIRASAKIISVKALEADKPVDETLGSDDDIVNTGGLEESMTSQGPVSTQHTEIVFEFSTSVEWIEMGTQVLVTPGGSPSLTGQPEQRDVASAGLDGYVGAVTQAYT